jgi:uncharacterized protein (DUF1810 family)
MKIDLSKYKTAQADCYKQVLKELKNGKKESHWMWFIFPQISGLGRTEISKKYAVKNIEEAIEYLSDEILCSRLIELTNILAYDIEDKTAEEIFGFVDCLKFHSCLTLFISVINSNITFQEIKQFQCFEDALQKYYDGNFDLLTLRILKGNK